MARSFNRQWATEWPQRTFKPYRYFRATLHKDFSGASLQVVLPIGAVAVFLNEWQTTFENGIHCKRNWSLSLNWGKPKHLNKDGGNLFEHARRWSRA